MVAQYLQLQLKAKFTSPNNTLGRYQFNSCRAESIVLWNVLHALSEASGLLLREEDVGAAVEGVADEGFASVGRFGIVRIPCRAPDEVTRGDVPAALFLHVRIVVAVCYSVGTVVRLLVAFVTMGRCAQPCFAHIIYKFWAIELASSCTSQTKNENISLAHITKT